MKNLSGSAPEYIYIDDLLCLIIATLSYKVEFSMPLH